MYPHLLYVFYDTFFPCLTDSKGGPVLSVLTILLLCSHFNIHLTNLSAIDTS